jgi:predicted MFS family arabinose efflux permease
LPSLVERENVFEGNSKLATSQSLAEIGGPPLAGVLIQAISAPLAIFFDALSFLLSAVSLTLIRKPEPPPAPRRDNASVWREIVEGLHVIASNPVLRTIAVGMGVRAFFGNFFGTLYTLFAIRDLGLTPGVLGVLVGAGGVGALIGSALAPRLVQRFGLGRTLTGALLCSAIINWLIPLAGVAVLWAMPLVASTTLAASMLIIGQVIGDGAMVVYAVNDLSLRQTAVPDRLLGRVNASMDFLAQGIAPVGAVLAGLLAEPSALGTRSTLFIAVLGILATSLWMLRSPIRRLHSVHDFVLNTSASSPTL